MVKTSAAAHFLHLTPHHIPQGYSNSVQNSKAIFADEMCGAAYGFPY